MLMLRTDTVEGVEKGHKGKKRTQLNKFYTNIYLKFANICHSELLALPDWSWVVQDCDLLFMKSTFHLEEDVLSQLSKVM